MASGQRWAFRGPSSILIRIARRPRAYKDIFIPLNDYFKPAMDCPPAPALARIAGRDPAIHHRREQDGAAMNDNAFGIREGEIAVELPKDYDASLYFIGRIRTPWKTRDQCPKNARESEAVCTLELDPRWAQALTGGE